MSNLLENNEEPADDTINTAKININAWRKYHSFVDPNKPLLRRRMSQGEPTILFYYLD